MEGICGSVGKFRHTWRLSGNLGMVEFIFDFYWEPNQLAVSSFERLGVIQAACNPFMFTMLDLNGILLVASCCLDN